MLYHFDAPTSLFPSFHAACAIVLQQSLKSQTRLARAAVMAWAVALCCSCVLTKQHYMLDVAVGAVVGRISFRIATAQPARATVRLFPAKAF
jgi:membrane-associated phospholipid phosphatase